MDSIHENKGNRHKLEAVLKEYSDAVLSPQLAIQNHRTVMLLIGSDFSFVSNPGRTG